MSDHLFAEMDAIVDALRANDPTLRESLSDELQLEFRQLQRRRMPQLGRDQFLDLFHVWHDGYLARLEAEPAATHKRMAENDCKLRQLMDEQRRAAKGVHSMETLFTCPCGEVIADPFDPHARAARASHFQAASLERVREALERWRYYYAGNSADAAD